MYRFDRTRFGDYNPLRRTPVSTSQSGYDDRAAMVNLFGYRVNATSLEQTFKKWADSLTSNVTEDSKIGPKGVDILSKAVRNVATAFAQLPTIATVAETKQAIFNPADFLDLLAVDLKTIVADFQTVYHVFASLTEVLKQTSSLEAVRFFGTAYQVLTSSDTDRDLNERFGRMISDLCHSSLNFSDQSDDPGEAVRDEATSSRKGRPVDDPDFSYQSLFNQTRRYEDYNNEHQ